MQLFKFHTSFLLSSFLIYFSSLLIGIVAPHARVLVPSSNGKLTMQPLNIWTFTLAPPGTGKSMAWKVSAERVLAFIQDNVGLQDGRKKTKKKLLIQVSY